mmetsp:Transcript_14835/g.40977  ORF Transcript_14835/g.40977 Transcript_14835/m.40977 type:complete len:467 (-) Transcript_14835:53-1453(-)
MLGTLFHFCNALVVIMAIAIGMRVYLFSQPCSSDEIVELPMAVPGDAQSTTTSYSIPACQVFSESYEQARSVFRAQAKSLGLPTWSLPIVPQDDYTTDIAVLPGDQDGLVIHTSGTHGVEGYAGSAIQLTFLQQIASQYANNNNDKPGEWKPLAGMPTVILVHAVNPSGMALYRRTNEHNVDLNRNALTNQELESLTTTHVNHENYRRFDDELFNYPHERPPSKFYSYFGIWCKAASKLLSEGYLTLKAAMVAGQYYQKEGIFYGGSTKETSITKLEAWFQEYFANQSFTKTFGGITWIDVHTGLGPMGVDTLLVNYPVRSKQGEEIAKWFPEAGYTTLSLGKDEEQGAVGKGYEQSKGFLIDYFEDYILPNSSNVENDYKDDSHILMMVQEFGTVPGVLVGHSLMLENAAHLSESWSPSQKLEWAKQTTGRAFYPQSPVWRRRILTRGMTLLSQAMARSVQWRPS